MENNKNVPDFGGYATKVGIKCSDGRTILPVAFEHQNGSKVPLVWNHCIGDPENILGFVELEHRDDGVYCYGYFTPDAETSQHAKKLVKQGAIDSLSIRAAGVTTPNGMVVHGDIQEVSLVISGANKGAKIQELSFQHADGSVITDESEVIISFGMPLQKKAEFQHAETTANSSTIDDNMTIGDVFDSFTDEQKNVVYVLISEALAEQNKETVSHSEEGEYSMKQNVFDSTETQAPNIIEIIHTAFPTIVDNATKNKSSFKDEMKRYLETTIEHAGTYGIDNIEVLFPEAKTLRTTPDFVDRDQSWVSGVLAAVNKVPFSRIKSMYADITKEEARAKGYLKGNKKIEEVFAVYSRTTTPTTVYKKQRLDREDIIDITDFDVVMWLWAEMLGKLKEELARAILIGDGREVTDQDHIKTENIRPILTDDDFYAPKVQADATVTPQELSDLIVRARKEYKGSGNPVFYTTSDVVTDFLLMKDLNQRRIYETRASLTAGLNVRDIVEVEVMENIVRTDASNNKFDLIGILVNLSDYTVGSTRGGEISKFDDFDIDYNQYKYLIETRLCGALTKYHSAVIIEKKQTA